MTDGPSAPSGLALAFELLVAELARSKSIDLTRFVKELETAAKSLGKRQQESDAARLLRLMAVQLTEGVKPPKK